MTENQYQARLIKKLKLRFPGCIVMKNDSGWRQGFLDLTLLYNDRWAALEVKTSPTASKQPNQEYYVEQLNGLSFAAFIYPENEEEVLDALQRTFTSGWSARVSSA